MIWSRRAFLAGLAAGGVAHTAAADTVPSAADLAKQAETPKDLSALTITNKEGAPVSLSDWAGRWVVLVLWAPWCGPCRREMPQIERLSKQLDPSQAVVVPLGFDRRGPAWIAKFYRENGNLDLPIFLGDGENLQAILGDARLPTTLVIAPDGTHAFTVTGEASWDDPDTLAWIKGLPASSL